MQFTKINFPTPKNPDMCAGEQTVNLLMSDHLIMKNSQCLDLEGDWGFLKLPTICPPSPPPNQANIIYIFQAPIY